jgi:hypothetical protein
MNTNRIFSILLLLLPTCMVITSCTPHSSPAAPSSIPSILASTQPPTVEFGPTGTPTASVTPGLKAPLIYSNPQHYAIQYTVVIQNRGFSPSDIRLYLPMPGEWESQRALSFGEITPRPQYQTVDENAGGGMVYWQLKGAPKTDTSQVFILPFELTAYETNTSIDPAAVQAYQTGTSDYKLYTRSEKYIEVNDPKIMQLADEIAGDETNLYLLARKFYDYILDTKKYQLLEQGLNGAKFILENGYGECGDYSALFIALSRAKGIPARPVIGYWAISGNEQTHVWAEFYLEGIGWIPVDATIGQQSSAKRAYYFGNMDNQRVILSKGYNHVLTPAGPDGYVAPILQVPLWWFWGSGEPSQLQMTHGWDVDKD